MQPLISKPADALTGSARVPGDKSISHRALMLGALAIGETGIEGLLAGEDVMRTAAAMRSLGAEVDRDGDLWRVWGPRAWAGSASRRTCSTWAMRAPRRVCFWACWRAIR